MSENQKVLHHSQFAALKGIEAKNDKLSELGKDYDIENLISAGITSDTDINEFVDKDFKIYTVYEDKIEEYSLEELLPYSFKI